MVNISINVVLMKLEKLMILFLTGRAGEENVKAMQVETN
jgi:hypothetical protein